MSIHATAILDPQARLGADVEIGPYTVVEGAVEIGDGTRIGPHCHLVGPLVLGRGNEVFFSSSLGQPPQIKEPTAGGRVRIGDRNVFREFAQVHRSMHAEGETVIGNDNFFMTTAHVAHDCVVGDHVVMASDTALGGHVRVGDRANIGGGTLVHQFCEIGEVAMVSGLTPCGRSVPPFSTVAGWRIGRHFYGLNRVGLRRAGVSRPAMAALKQAFRTVFSRDGSLEDRLAAVDAGTPEVARLLAFLKRQKRPVYGLGDA